MSEAPSFSSLIVSRPVRVAGPLRRAALVAVACVLHLGAGAAVMLGQLFVLEVVPPPRATSPELPIFFRPPTLRTTAPGPGHSGSRRRAEPVSAPADRRQDAGRRSAGGPRPRAIAPPTDLDPDAPAPWPGTGGPGGESDGAPGSDGPGDGCPDCDGIGDGPGAPWSTFDDLRESEDPRLVPPVPISAARALPKYPGPARRAHVEGTVILLIVITAAGEVGEIEVMRSPDQAWGFDLAAVEAVKQWRYRPALLRGRPVAVQARVVVEFALSR
jgi:protein TonB